VANTAEARARALFHRIFEGVSVEWSAELLDRAARVALEDEFDRLRQEGKCLHTRSNRLAHVDSPGGHGCRQVLVNSLKLGFHNYALDLARAAVLVAPRHLENWLWLVGLLANPPFNQHYAAMAALREAFLLNTSHKIFEEQAAALFTMPYDSAALSEALGGTNATVRLWRARLRTKQSLFRRRAFQCECAEQGAGTPAGLSAWLRFGELLRRSRWFSAAAGVLGHLESTYHLADEERRAPPNEGAVARIRAFEVRLRTQIDEARDAWTTGMSLDLHRQHAPTPQEVIDPVWLAMLEARTSEGGEELTASWVTGFALSWDSVRLRTVFSGVIR